MASHRAPAERPHLRHAGAVVAVLGIGAALAAAPSANATPEDGQSSESTTSTGRETPTGQSSATQGSGDGTTGDTTARVDTPSESDHESADRDTSDDIAEPRPLNRSRAANTRIRLGRDDRADESDTPALSRPAGQQLDAAPERATDTVASPKAISPLPPAAPDETISATTAAASRTGTPRMAAAQPTPASPATPWALITSIGQNFRRVFSNSTPTITYDPNANHLVESTGNIRGTIGIADADGDRLDVVLTKPAHGLVTVNPDGTFEYDPDDSFIGADRFQVSASDATEFHFHSLLDFFRPARGHTATKTIDIVVTTVNRPPVPGSPVFVIDGIDTATGQVRGTLQVSDPEGDALSYALAGGPAHAQGSIGIDSATARWTFTPHADARQQAYIAGKSFDISFNVIATDARRNSISLTVTAPVLPGVAVTGTATVPGTPSAPTVNPSATSVLVIWTPPATGGSAITRYSLRYRPLGGAWLVAPDTPAGATSATVTGLIERTDYEIAVRASNAQGNSPWSVATPTHTSGDVVTPGPDPETPPTGNVLWKDKFDTAPNGQLTKVTGDALFGPTAAPTNSATYAHGSIQSDLDGGKLLRQSIPAGELGAFIVSPRLSHPTDHAAISYEIRFDENFDWRWGGKMPGLVGVAPGHSIYEPTSGNADRSIGFSTRLMWHGRGDDGTRPFQGKLGPIPAGADNDIVTYVYAEQPAAGFNGFGWHTSLGSELERGQWHRITMEVGLNTVGERDGVFKVWVDGDLRYSATDWIYRDRADVMIEAVLYDIHRGGGTTPPSWVSTRDTHVDVRNMVVTEL